MALVLVVDRERKPRAPVHPGRARHLLTSGRAAVWRRSPFTLVMKEAPAVRAPEPLRLKLDPGSKTTEVAHRGHQVRERLEQRRACRRPRRQRPTRYRPKRFANVTTWVARLRQVAPVGALSQELVRFDTQQPEIGGVEYQQGEFAGDEVRAYLLEKWRRACVYCGGKGVPLHIVPKVRGGSDRVSNLMLACAPCNQAKGTRTAEEFGHPQVQAKHPLREAAVNASRWALYHQLEARGLPVEVGTGGRAKGTRTQWSLPKTPWLDATCVGASTSAVVQVKDLRPVGITAMGRQMCRTAASGFPDKAPKATSVVGGFIGDLVRAVVPASRMKAGVSVGRIAVRATGACNVKTAQGIHWT